VSNIQPLTLQDVEDAVEINVNNDTDTPAEGEDEWNVRMGLAQRAVGVWEGQDVLWDELWTTYTHGSTATAATTYTLTFTDFRFKGSWLRLTLSGSTTKVPLISPEEAQNYETNARVAWITGNNKTGWTLNLGWTPVDGDGTFGATITFDYYKHAFKPTAAADKFEMSDPEFVIHWVTAQKSLLESQNNKYSVYSGEAQRVLETMKVMNLIGSPNSSDTVDDMDAINSNAVLGE
jgi:hypothetical protein